MAKFRDLIEDMRKRGQSMSIDEYIDLNYKIERHTSETYSGLLAAAEYLMRCAEGKDDPSPARLGLARKVIARCAIVEDDAGKQNEDQHVLGDDK